MLRRRFWCLIWILSLCCDVLFFPLSGPAATKTLLHTTDSQFTSTQFSPRISNSIQIKIASSLRLGALLGLGRKLLLIYLWPGTLPPHPTLILKAKGMTSIYTFLDSLVSSLFLSLLAQYHACSFSLIIQGFGRTRLSGRGQSSSIKKTNRDWIYPLQIRSLQECKGKIWLWVHIQTKYWSHC